MRNTKYTQKELNVIYRNYILQAIKSTGDIMTEYGEDCKNDADRILFVLNDFVRVANHPYNKIKFPNVQARIADWFTGLPGVIDIEFRNYGILQLCKAWGVLNENATKKEEDKILGNWFSFMANQLLKVAKFYKIDYSFIY